MPTLPAIQPATASDQAKEALDEVRKSLGSIPNMAKSMAHSPALVKAWLAMSGALAGGALPPAVRERISLATAEHNRCSYCLSAHTFLAKKVAKLDDEEIERARHATSADPHVAALLALADAISNGHGSVEDPVLDAARAAGATDAEIAEVVGNVALNILTNYFNILAGTESEFPLVTPHTHA
jgi:uncharacterized peroxidase-related enzyme